MVVTHTLTGEGIIAIANPEALRIELSDVPAHMGEYEGVPRSLPKAGTIGLGSSRGWLRRYYVSRDDEIVDQLGGRYDLFGYQFAPGITALVTEYPLTELEALFDATTGHNHDGAGEGALITTLGLAAGAAARAAYGSVGAITTTSTTFVDLSGTLTLAGCLAGNVILAWLVGVVKLNSGAGRPLLGISINGVDTGGPRVEASGLLTTHAAVALAVNQIGTVTIKPRVRSADGQSITCDGGQLVAVELRR